MAFKSKVKSIFSAPRQPAWYHIYLTTRPAECLEEIQKHKHDIEHSTSITEARVKAIRGIELSKAMGGTRYPIAYIFKGNESIPVGVVYFQNRQAYYLNPNFEYRIDSDGSISDPVPRCSSIWH